MTYQCSSCGGFCNKSGCQRDNVAENMTIECTCAAKDMPFGRCCKATTSASVIAGLDMEELRKEFYNDGGKP